MAQRSKHITTTITALTLLLFSCGFHAAAQDWHLKKDDDGIKVYTADVENSAFKSIKVECTVKATFSQFVALLLDIDKQPEWVYGSKSAKVVKVGRPDDFIFYSEVNVPWPCADRDYVAHITVTQPSPQLVTIDSHSEPDMVPVKDGVVRVRKSSAHWEVTAINKDLLKLVYTVSFDPAGSVPAWLTNMFVIKGPFQTFQKLRDYVALPKYKDTHYPFIKD